MKSKNTILAKLPQQKWFYPLCAFLIPFLGMLAVMYIGNTLTAGGTSRYSPFGSWSMLYSDTYHQYYPFFKEFRRALLSGESLLYNWSVGLGLDYLGLLSYYLASPLNLLSVFVPEADLLGYFSMLTPIRLGLAGMFFAVFLQGVFHRYDISTAVFGSFYGLCAWAMGYLWNVMWLDTFALLPLVMLGMVSMFRERKFVLYTVTLTLSVAINYYIGFFTCIFVFLTFFCYQICRWKNWRTFLIDFAMIAGFSVIALGLTAVLSLPTLAALQNTQSSVNSFPKDFRLNMVSEHNLLGLLQAMLQVAGNMNGGIAPTFKEGLPNVYCGVFSTVLLFVYLFNREIRLRDKLCASVLLLFLNASFAIRQLDYIWHGFHFTNMIPYRFSFLYSFVALYMAYTAWEHRKSIQLWQPVLAAIMSTGILLCYKEFGTQGFNSTPFLAYNIILIVLYVAVLLVYGFNSRLSASGNDTERFAQQLFRRAMRQRICTIVFLFIMGGELVLNLVNFGTNFNPTSVTDYPRGTTATADVIDYMHKREEDTLFYRAETSQTSTLNGGALNGYNGVTTFTSSANVKVTEFMQQLGYAAKNTYNRYAYEEASPVANLFLGLKYMIVRDGRVEENPYFDDVYSNGNVHLLENNAYLPLCFLADSRLLELNYSALGNRFGYQNVLIQASTGLSENVWYLLPGKDLNISANGPSITPQPNTGYCSYSTAEETGNVVFTYTADREGFMCVDMDLSNRNTFSIYHNGTFLYNDTYSLPQMASVCAVKPGDVVEVRLKCDNKNENGTLRVSAAILDEGLFRKAYGILAESTLELTSFENTHIQGTINCNRDGVLYTSIPQNGNWYAIVDGEPAETVLIEDAMVGLVLTEGSHEIEFVYRNSAYKLGLAVTACCAIIFIIPYLFVYHPDLFRKQRKRDAQ